MSITDVVELIQVGIRVTGIVAFSRDGKNLGIFNSEVFCIMLVRGYASGGGGKNLVL